MHAAQGTTGASQPNLGTERAAELRLASGTKSASQILSACLAAFARTDLLHDSQSGSLQSARSASGLPTADQAISLLCLAICAVLAVGSDRHLFEIAAAALADERSMDEAKTPAVPWRVAAVIRALRGRLLAGAANALGICLLTQSATEALAPHPLNGSPIDPADAAASSSMGAGRSATGGFRPARGI